MQDFLNTYTTMKKIHYGTSKKVFYLERKRHLVVAIKTTHGNVPKNRTINRMNYLITDIFVGTVF